MLVYSFLLIYLFLFFLPVSLPLKLPIFYPHKTNTFTSSSINSRSLLSSLSSPTFTQSKTSFSHYKPENIRNFCIVAHIDHGKSTLTQKLLEYTKKSIQQTQNAYINSKLKAVDSLPSEVSRGITIKSRAIRLEYLAKNGEKYLLNLVDTPGHVDFSHEGKNQKKKNESKSIALFYLLFSLT